MQTLETKFDEGIARYKEGESADSLLPTFKEICTQAPKNSAAQTCLAWLYLLADKPNAAYKAAQRAVKIAPQDPQARVNLAIADARNRQERRPRSDRANCAVLGSNG